MAPFKKSDNLPGRMGAGQSEPVASRMRRATRKPALTIFFGDTQPALGQKERCARGADWATGFLRKAKGGRKYIKVILIAAVEVICGA
jgi:hypothetical protein